MFVDTRKVGFSDWVTRYLQDLPKTKFPLQEHQKVVSRFLTNSPYRGVLLYHGLGSGKSCAAIAAAASISRRNVIVLLPASLKPNFENEISKCGSELKSRITWVSTNGIPVKSITSKTIKNVAIEGSCVIIDEVHNFISQVTNGGKRGLALFDALFLASNVKLIFLSGTPIINKPFEIGVLLNLLNGPVKSIVFKRFKEDQSTVSTYLRSNKWVDRFEFNGKSVNVWLTPLPFYKDSTGKLITDTSSSAVSEQVVIKEIRDELDTIEFEVVFMYIYPNSEQEFNKSFLNSDENMFVNRSLFKRSALGKVSYFQVSSKDASSRGFPTIIEKPMIVLEMSGLQFDAYITQRTVEIQLEMRLQDARRGRDDQITSGVFRAFSRAVCNFAFDNDSKIKRIFPSSYRAMIKELGTLNDDELSVEKVEGDAENIENSLPTYEKMLISTLDALRNSASELRGMKLKSHSPKFYEILENLKSNKGKSLVYSQFRRVEGLGILELVLEANGFAKFTIGAKGVPKSSNIKLPQFVVFDSSDENTKNLVKAFNGEFDGLKDEIRSYLLEHKPEIRILLITQSGAEGINLRGVRNVHIVEPYWNEIRIQQVIGRAARFDSHVHLPPKQRTVTVYRYIVEIPKKQDNFTIRNVDKNLSSDQIVLGNAKDKMVLVESFLDAIRASAIDCKEKCYKFPKGLDPNMDVGDVQPDPKTMQVRDNNGVREIFDPETGEIYDYKQWKNHKILVQK